MLRSESALIDRPKVANKRALLRPSSAIFERPKLTAKRTIRLPIELDEYMKVFAADRHTTVESFILDSLENELKRLVSYRVSLYLHLMPLVEGVQRRHCQTTLAYHDAANGAAL